MGRVTTQRREHQAFESFRRDFLLPEGRVHYSDKPDVVIDGPRKIGVEITDLHLVDGKNPDSEQVQRQHRETVLARAQALYMEAGGRPIELVVAFAYAERRIASDERLSWIPPGRFLLNRGLCGLLLTSWRTDYEERAIESDLCVMAGLKQPPRFDDVQSWVQQASVQMMFR